MARTTEQILADLRENTPQFERGEYAFSDVLEEAIDRLETLERENRDYREALAKIPGESDENCWEIAHDVLSKHQEQATGEGE